MQRDDTLYTLVFAALVCGVCSILVSGFAVGLKSRQEMKAENDVSKCCETKASPSMRVAQAISTRPS